MKPTRTELRALCLEAGRMLRLENAETWLDDGRSKLDGVSVALMFDSTEYPEWIFFYLDILPVDDENRISTYEYLLSLNLMRPIRSLDVFGYDPSTSHAIMTSQVLAKDMSTPLEIANSLRRYVTLVNDIRSHLQSLHLPTAGLQPLSAQFA